MTETVAHRYGQAKGLGRTDRRVLVIVCLTCLLLLSVFFITQGAVSRERENAYAQVADFNSEIARSDEVRIRNLLASLDKVLLVLREDFSEQPHMSKAHLLSRIYRLKLGAELNPRITFTDASGSVVLSTGRSDSADGRTLSLADREYFQTQITRQDDLLNVAVPVQSRISGKWVIPLVRRISNKDGSFAGIVLMSVEPGLFSDSFEKTSLGVETSRAIVGLDGYTRIRLSDGKFEFGGDIHKSQLFKEIKKSTVGTYTSVAVSDGDKRLVSYRVIDPYALVVAGESSVDSIEASYRAEVHGYITTASLVAALSLALSGVLIVGVLRQKKLIDSQQRFQQLIEMVPQLVSNLDLQGNIQWVNQRTVHFIGASPEARAQGYDWVLGAIHPADQGRVKAFLSDALQARPSAESCEYRNRRFDGDYLWFSAQITLILDKDGLGTSFLQTATDIHDRRMTEERTRITQQLESIGQLTGGMAHDFNNLLAIIVGNLDLLKPTVSEEKDAKRLGVALGAAQRGVQLVKSLLALASKTPLLPATMDLYALVESIAPLLRTALGQRIQLLTQAPPTALSVEVDGGGLESVLLNLCVNARDAMPDGGTLVLAFNASEGMAHMTVCDNGVGMSETVLRRATEPFFTTKTRDHGTGLGLSMVSGFVSQSGGRLEIQSTLGKGTCIGIFLPLVAPAMPTQLTHEQATPAAFKHVPCRILVVDDQPDIAALLRVWLEQDGHSTVLASCAEDALVLLSSNVFQIMLSDITMPGELDGIQLAHRAQATYPKLRILLMSGYSRATAKSRVDVPWPLLVKPFSKADFDAQAWKV